MSGILKPTVSFTNSTTPNKLINVDEILQAEALDIPAPPNGPASEAKYQILFSFKPNSVPQHDKVEFTTSAARNTSLTNLKTTINTAIA